MDREAKRQPGVRDLMPRVRGHVTTGTGRCRGRVIRKKGEGKLLMLNSRSPI